jgi:hypothetical protein
MDWSKFTLTSLDQVTVLGQTVKVIHRKPKKSSYGEYDCAKREIYLNKDLKGMFALRVLLHEMKHAELRLAGMDYHLSEPVEEQLCTLAESTGVEILGLVFNLVLGSDENGNNFQ